MWFTEDPRAPVVICAIIAALAFVSWLRGQYTRDLWIIGLMLVAAAACVVVDLVVETDAERVASLLDDMADAVERNDIEGTLGFISQQAQDIRLRVEAGMALVQVEGRVRVTDTEFVVRSRGSQIASHFRANGTVAVREHDGQGPARTRWEMTWQKEAGDWKIVHVQRLNFLTGEPIEMLSSR